MPIPLDRATQYNERAEPGDGGEQQQREPVRWRKIESIHPAGRVECYRCGDVDEGGCAIRFRVRERDRDRLSSERDRLCRECTARLDSWYRKRSGSRGWVVTKRESRDTEPADPIEAQYAAVDRAKRPR